MKILITDGSYKNSLCAARSLKNLDYQIACVGGPYCITNTSKYVNHKGFEHNSFGKFGSNITDEIIDPLLDHIAKERYNLILPVGGNSVKIFSKIRKRIENYTKIVIPNDNTIDIALDKIKSANICKDLSINVPKTYNYKSLDEVIANKKEIIFPVITKSPHELFELSTQYFDNFEKLITSLKKFSSTNKEALNFPIIQQKINGPGIGYFAVFNKGEVVSEFMHERVREIPPSGGSSTCAKSIFDENLKNLGMKLLKTLNWHGPAMVEFKKNTQDKKIYFMEINPKLWGSLDLSYACGVNFTKDIIDVSLDKNKDIFIKNKKYKVDKKFSWPIEGDFKHAFQNPKNIFPVLIDFLNPKVSKNIYLSDFMPSIASIYIIIRNILSAPLKYFGILRIYSLSKSIGMKNALIRLFTEKSGIPIKRYSKITENIYVGAQYKKIGLKIIHSWDIDMIISLRDEEIPNLYNIQINNLHLPTIEFKPLSLDLLIKGSNQIHDCIRNKQNVYIHCREGVSRAPCLVAAYLIKTGLSIDESINLIKKSRPFINILENQITSLKNYEIYLKNLNNKKP